MRKKVLLSIIALNSALALSGCGNKTETPEVTSVVEPVSFEPLTEPVTQTEAVTEPETVDPYYIPEGMMRSYLTGELISEGQGNRRPVAVMLNNIIDAIPQTGISRAGVVYEAPVEGGLTRLMGIFENYDDLDKIGSVRSARTYYVYFAKEFDAIYAHYGQCEYALPLLNSSEIDNISGLESVGNVAYYRTSDRKAPHNAYTSAECIQDGIDYLGYNTAYPEGYDGHYRFAQGNEVVTLDEGEDAKKVVVGYPNNKPWFEYNESDNLYYRFQYGAKQIDDMNGEQLAYRNIIMQYCGWESYYGTQYLNINVSSGGAGKYITNGKAIDITWQKDSQYGKTRYYDETGNEIVLNQGKTWVCIIQKDQTDRIEILSEN